MRMRHLLSSVVLVSVTAAITSVVVSQDPPAMPDMSVLQPGENHRHFDDLVGDWKNVYTLYEQPGADPMTFEGTSSSEWVLDKHFLKTSSSYEAMGMAIEDINLGGYDNFREQYIMFYASSFGTGWSLATGTKDEDGTITWNGSQDMPHMNMRDVKYRIVEKRVDKDHFTMEFWYENDAVEGGWFKQMLIDSTRR
ncbi:MAG: DUF1579 family protein [Planctomycetota bacterium]|nr:DUF1579 family protein [Planctomycetota bacterium]